MKEPLEGAAWRGFFLCAPGHFETLKIKENRPCPVTKKSKAQRAPIKAWVKGVPVEHEAQNQLRNVASLPFIHSHIAVMPDVHFGIGATVGSVIPTKGAIIPAAVGVDIGCGMMAVRTSLTANDLPDSLVAFARRDRAQRAARQRPERQSPRHALFGGHVLPRLRPR